jgi:hypothetical protein
VTLAAGPHVAGSGDCPAESPTHARREIWTERNWVSSIFNCSRHTAVRESRLHCYEFVALTPIRHLFPRLQAHRSCLRWICFALPTRPKNWHPYLSLVGCRPPRRGFSTSGTSTIEKFASGLLPPIIRKRMKSANPSRSLARFKGPQSIGSSPSS